MPLNLFLSLLGAPAQEGRIIELVGPKGLGKTTVVRDLFNYYGGEASWLAGVNGNATLEDAITIVQRGVKLVVVDGWQRLPDDRASTLESRLRMQLFRRLSMACYTRGAVVVFTSDLFPWGTPLDGVRPLIGGDQYLKYYAADRLHFSFSVNGAKVTLTKSKTPASQGARLFGETFVVWRGESHVQSA